MIPATAKASRAWGGNGHFSGEFEKAAPEFRRGEELAPNNADVLSISGACGSRWLGAAGQWR